MTQEEKNKIFHEMERKRMQIAKCLFSPQFYVHSSSMSRKLVSLASELAELAALLEYRDE
jgi:hypothetical protein